jgi:hypothetical protein
MGTGVGAASGTGAASGNGGAGDGGAGEAVKAVENFETALENVSNQLQPLMEVPWPTLTAR